MRIRCGQLPSGEAASMSGRMTPRYTGGGAELRAQRSGLANAEEVVRVHRGPPTDSGRPHNTVEAAGLSITDDRTPVQA